MAYYSHFWSSKCYILYETWTGTSIMRTFWGVNQVCMTSSSRDMMYQWIDRIFVMTSFTMSQKLGKKWRKNWVLGFFSWLYGQSYKKKIKSSLCSKFAEKWTLGDLSCSSFIIFYNKKGIFQTISYFFYSQSQILFIDKSE